ncbi:MAG: pentapeptide repeat-containing protein [Phycisphaerae bacterium]|nr:pentapeptide repeat-containing protein [Phycisphaerae bacterium]
MAKSSPKLKATKPKNVFTKPLQADFKALFKALGSGIGHTVCGKWEEIGADTAEALSAIGVATEPEELVFLLIRRSMTKALFDLIGESAGGQLTKPETDTDTLLEQLDFSICAEDVQIDQKFLDRPTELPLIKNLQSLLRQWLEGLGVAEPAAAAIVDRLPSYFLYALNEEWRRNAKSYRPLLEALDTPFARAGEREWAWSTYSALLRRRVQESIFDEPFSLSQIYVGLNAFFYEEEPNKDLTNEIARTGRERRRVVIALKEELQNWLENPNPQNVIRVISGGPGSGKSSFARIFAAQLSENPKIKVLYVPLHLIDPARDIVEEIGRFVRDEGVLPSNPLDPDSPEANLLIIFDGLDELAGQGKAAAETARGFIREVERTVEKRNLQRVKLRVLISGRELVVQENESEFRRPRQILNLLPYFVSRPSDDKRHPVREDDEYDDPHELLKVDLREQWWENYGVLTGRGFGGLPKELGREDLREITAQPLLNYLVALSFTREKLDFTKDINLNAIYADLVGAVHERGYEKHRIYGPIRHMKADEFSRVLEEIGLAAWHGDGRTTTVREIEDHCRASGVGVLLDAFQEGAKAGVTRLLAAFFFRQYGRRPSGDPTFVFTHKSFGEYLAARRVVRAIERIARELERRANNPDEGWDERDALKHWAQICGPAAISRYLHAFLLNEIGLRSPSQLVQWQGRLATLFGYVLRQGMPMEQLQIGPFRDVLFQSRNAEEALLAALNACARVTGQMSPIEHPTPTAFGAWFKRIQGQRSGPDSTLASECLSFLNLKGITLYISDFYETNLRSSDLEDLQASMTCFSNSNLCEANLRRAILVSSKLSAAALQRADLQQARLMRADLHIAVLREANLERANLEGANLEGANLEGANLEGASLEKANLEKANLEGANLEGARLKGANLPTQFRAKALASESRTKGD